MNAHILLGCHGSRLHGISMCKGTYNKVCNLSELGQDEEEILDHLDNYFKLFDTVLEDINQVNNIINYLNRLSVISDSMLKILYSYIAMHKNCGFYMFIDSN